MKIIVLVNQNLNRTNFERFNLKLNKINENPFECIEQKNKKDLFSLDFFGNFSLSSRFDALNMKEKYKKNSTLHSIFGKCEIKKEEWIKLFLFHLEKN